MESHSNTTHHDIMKEQGFRKQNKNGSCLDMAIIVIIIICKELSSSHR